MPKILLAHPTGNTFSRALLKGLLDADALGLFATTIAVAETNPLLKIAPGKLRAELLRRQFDVSRDQLFTHPFLEIVRLAAGRFNFASLDRHETGVASFDAVYASLSEAISRRLAALKPKHGLTAVYGYEMGSLAMFRAARDLGLERYYDLPIAYWQTSQRLLAEEARRWPQWESTLLAVRDSEAKCQRKVEEIELANLVVCPSQFVLQSIPESIRNGRRCIVAEFGSPVRKTPPSFKPAGGKLRILFAGSMTQRKGLADLFAAMKLLKRKDVELVALGSPLAPMEFYRKEYPDFVHEPPRPHSKVLELMESCDALVLPSIVEGRALVQQEAMSSGLVLIATPNAGGDDLIVDGETGFLTPIRSPEAIASRIQWLADNRSALPDMKKAAFEKAASVTWARYVEKIWAAISGLVPASEALPV